jgi:ferredoxin-like protein FixX
MKKIIELLKNEKKYLKNKVFRFKEDLETIAEINQALQLLQTDVVKSFVCNNCQSKEEKKLTTSTSQCLKCGTLKAN